MDADMEIFKKLFQQHHNHNLFYLLSLYHYFAFGVTDESSISWPSLAMIECAQSDFEVHVHFSYSVSSYMSFLLTSKLLQETY